MESSVVRALSTEQITHEWRKFPLLSRTAKQAADILQKPEKYVFALDDPSPDEKPDWYLDTYLDHGQNPITVLHATWKLDEAIQTDKGFALHVSFSVGGSMDHPDGVEVRPRLSLTQTNIPKDNPEAAETITYPLEVKRKLLGKELALSPSQPNSPDASILDLVKKLERLDIPSKTPIIEATLATGRKGSVTTLPEYRDQRL